MKVAFGRLSSERELVFWGVHLGMSPLKLSRPHSNRPSLKKYSFALVTTLLPARAAFVLHLCLPRHIGTYRQRRTAENSEVVFSKFY